MEMDDHVYAIIRDKVQAAIDGLLIQSKFEVEYPSFVVNAPFSEVYHVVKNTPALKLQLKLLNLDFIAKTRPTDHTVFLIDGIPK